jgi:hypothetical protein
LIGIGVKGRCGNGAGADVPEGGHGDCVVFD